MRNRSKYGAVNQTNLTGWHEDESSSAFSLLRNERLRSDQPVFNLQNFTTMRNRSKKSETLIPESSKRQLVKEHYETWFRSWPVERKPDSRFISISDIERFKSILLAKFDVEKNKLVYLSKKAVAEFIF